MLQDKRFGFIIVAIMSDPQKEIEQHLYAIAQHFDSGTDEGYESAIEEADQSLIHISFTWSLPFSKPSSLSPPRYAFLNSPQDRSQSSGRY